VKVTTTATTPHKEGWKMIRGVWHEQVCLLSNGLPILEWIPVVEEQEPPEYPCGYMQRRGAA
jgi:hypothetical protein